MLKLEFASVDCGDDFTCKGIGSVCGDTVVGGRTYSLPNSQEKVDVMPLIVQRYPALWLLFVCSTTWHKSRSRNGHQW